jgi:hypothetical protein
MDELSALLEGGTILKAVGAIFVGYILYGLFFD